MATITLNVSATSTVPIFTLSTNSTNSSWKADTVVNSGTDLHWEVTGAVTASADGNTPTFDFSPVGTKNIVITSPDSFVGVTFIAFGGFILDINITETVVENLPDLGLLQFFSSPSLATLSISTLKSLTAINITGSNISSLDLSNNSLLEQIQAESCGFTSLDLSNNPNLSNVDLASNNLTVGSANTILDQLIAHNNTSGNTLDISTQSPPIVPDAGKVTTLEGIWNSVIV